MSRLNSTLIALVLGATAAAGLFAAVRTVRLGQNVPASQTVSATPQAVAARRAKLLRWSRSLEHARAKHPPALPKIPKFAPVPVPAAPPSAPAATGSTTPAPPVKYVRPAPVIKYQQTAQPVTSTSAQSTSEDGREPETESGGGGDD